MTYYQLLHAIRAACTVSNDVELFVFGSQSILAHLNEIPDELVQSIEVDVSPVNKPEKVIDIDGVLGEGSLFHQTHGFYVHGVSIETAILPKNWQQRCKIINDKWQKDYNGFCISLPDLAVSKLMAYRERDKEFVEILLINKLINSEEINFLINQCDVDIRLKNRAITWLNHYLSI